VKVLESTVVDGITRVRFSGRLSGWASLTSKGGDVLLKLAPSAVSTAPSGRIVLARTVY
jgi:hypothetical protein